MFFLTPIIAGLIIVGTLGGGVYVEGQAKDVVSRYNLSAVAHVLDIYNIDHGSYPDNLKEVVEEGEIKNLKLNDYNYESLEYGQKFVLKMKDGNGCWDSSKGGVINCGVGLDGIEPSTSTLIQ